MASNQLDPLQQLSLALAAPADSQQQADLLAALRESLEAFPSPIPVLCSTLLKTVAGPTDTLLKRWVLDLLHFAICRSSLTIEIRTQLASQSLEVLAGVLNERNVHTVKVVIQCFATVYPLLFRQLCINRGPQQHWDVLSQAKAKILEFVWSQHAPSGVKLAAIKFMQRVVLVQTRGVNDPRLQNKNDPNLSMCPSDHPFISVNVLEGEGLKLLESIITMLYTSSNVDIISAILNSWANLPKQRPALMELVVSTLTAWTPSALSALPLSSIKSVERSLRILMMHIMRGPGGSAYTTQIQTALSNQAARMEKAIAEDKARKDALRKRPPSSTPSQEGPESKRPKLETGGPAPVTLLAGFDFTTLPAALVTELIVANLQAFSEAELMALVHAFRQKGGAQLAPAAPGDNAEAGPSTTSGPSYGPPSTAASTSATTIAQPVRDESAPPRLITPSPDEYRTPSRSKSPTPMLVKEEPVDPLQMNIDEEEIEYEPDKLNLELSGGQEEAQQEEELVDEETELEMQEFKLPPPRELPDDVRDTLIRASLTRIWDGSKGLVSGSAAFNEAADISRTTPGDMWMFLLVRLVTRTADPTFFDEDAKMDTEQTEVSSDIYSYQDRLRQVLCDYIIQEFSSRVRLAITWMNEEWYNDQVRNQKEPDWRPNYEIWLNQLVAAYQTHLDNKDRSFSRFLLDLPAVPPELMSLLREMCVEADRRSIGFTVLREFVTQRPSLRDEAMNMLLELTTHPDKITRTAAINTVKRWIPEVEPMATMIRFFALQLLRRLQSRPKDHKPPEPHTNGTGEDHDEHMEDGQLPQEAIIRTSYLPEQLQLPAQDDEINQHLELLFSLSTKLPEFLDELFAAYGAMDATVQESIQRLITPLVRALGSSHGKLLALLRTFPPGAESLALRVLNIFTENGRPSAQLVALVKSLISERDLDARFLIPIIAEMDKAEILRHLPRIVSILNGQQETKNLVRSVFNSVVAVPPQTFGSVTSNLPRVRQSELLAPAELMVLLHESEKEIGLKAAIEAIGVCFSMTDIFRSDILAVVMNQLVDEPVLPTLFLRTVIQAVTTYRSLVPFVSSTLLTRLITKKIWTNPPLWEGFIRCAKVIAPASYGALLQLPKDQLRELADKQPSLKAGLREYVMKKGGNKARVGGLLDIFSDDDPHATKSVSDSPSVENTPLPEMQIDITPVDATPPPP
ncbi:hypothetical protein NM688_g6844 [Phlebia brevispora]|uniref:Uncharacterized protein n=1 Tax=Phlebia brevispora TaxID=194682 RepID=A0ACC1SBW8_9APHY|nr:hypothetical protein NM688_g6844 [Phlebia brevispora]